MKQLFTWFAVSFLAIGSFAQATTTDVNKPAIVFKEVKHDFGKIKQGTPVTFDFVFKNTSSQPVVIESATASCGCTTPVKPEAPVAKGKNSKITAGFNAAAAGPFDKTIYVKVTGTEKPMEIKIVGEVLNAEDFAKYEKAKNDKAKKSR
jgi:Protein of unknown function (DUF1573)